jgi:hypothetical protein
VRIGIVKFEVLTAVNVQVMAGVHRFFQKPGR